MFPRWLPISDTIGLSYLFFAMNILKLVLFVYWGLSMVVPKMLSSIEAAATFKSTSPGAIPRRDKSFKAAYIRTWATKLLDPNLFLFK